MDITTVLGVAFGIGCILLGQVLEGGNASSLVQLAAAVIVIGGTAGAVVTQFPARELRHGVQCLHRAVLERADESGEDHRHLVGLARLARRDGMLKLEDRAQSFSDPFLRHAVTALTEGHTTGQLRALLEAELERTHGEDEMGPRILESAGGYAPTIGILGAVLGLIQVMENLSQPDQLGAGIAVAFVSTLYGVASANLLFLPLAQKLRMKLDRDLQRREILVEGICAIQEGMNPGLLARRLEALRGPDA